MKRLIIFRLGVELVAAVCVMVIIPTSRYVVLGHCNNEPFSNHRPLSYWMRELQSPGEDDRRVAISNIGDIGPKAAAAIPELVVVVKQGHISMRSWAIFEGLSKIGPAAIPDLIEMLHDKSIRTVVVLALGTMGADGKDAVPALCTMFRDPSHWTRRMTCVALGKIGPAAKDAIPTLIALLKDPKTDYQDDVVSALSKIDPQATTVARER